MANQGGSGPGLAPPSSLDQQPSQHALQPQPASAAQPGAPQPPQSSFGGYPPGAAVNGMCARVRNCRRVANAGCFFVYIGYGPPPPPPAPSPGPGKGRRAAPGPATPQQAHVAYPDPRASPQIPRPAPPNQSSLVRTERIGNTLANWNPEDLPASQKRDGSDWYAVFNPEVQRVLDVELVHHLDHNSVVCCVRFSRDGKYLATGCNRSAQIFDVTSGQNVATLQDENVDKDGDLYIRSVCFSPDGKYLATGAEDKQIRVSLAPNRRSELELTDEFLRPSLGLGHRRPHHQAHFHWPRARHLLAGLCRQRPLHRLGQWR